MDIQLFLTLLAGHYVADFGLQTQFMTDKKRLVFIESIGLHALTAHAFIHALLTGLLSGSFSAAAIIGVTHWFIDLGKASAWLSQRTVGHDKGMYGIDLDQALHVLVILFVVLVVV